MQVHLKQSEIVTALKQYISGEGISLQGKTVDMTFTAGRKEAGISVEISIDDAGIPDFFKGEGEDPAQAPAPATSLSLVKDTATASIANDSTEKAAAPAAEASTEASGGDEGNVVQAESTTLIPAGKSLFN